MRPQVLLWRPYIRFLKEVASCRLQQQSSAVVFFFFFSLNVRFARICNVAVHLIRWAFFRLENLVFQRWETCNVLNSGGAFFKWRSPKNKDKYLTSGRGNIWRESRIHVIWMCRLNLSSASSFHCFFFFFGGKFSFLRFEEDDGSFPEWKIGPETTRLWVSTPVP